MIELRKISILDDAMKECITLRVTSEQEDFVASNAISLAEAYDCNGKYDETGEGTIAVPYAVYENDIMVGFAMYGFFPPGDDEDEDEAYNTEEPYYYFWRLFVDKAYQGRGLGREIVRCVMDEIKTKPYGEASYCYVSYDQENTASKATFSSYGFKEDGRTIDDELVAYYKL